MSIKTNKKATRIAWPIKVDLIINVFKSVSSFHNQISLRQIFTRRKLFVSEYFYRKINITPGTVNNFSLAALLFDNWDAPFFRYKNQTPTDNSAKHLKASHLFPECIQCVHWCGPSYIKNITTDRARVGRENSVS